MLVAVATLHRQLFSIEFSSSSHLMASLEFQFFLLNFVFGYVEVRSTKTATTAVATVKTAANCLYDIFSTYVNFIIFRAYGSRNNRHV